MPDIDKIDNVEDSAISKINGVTATGISKVNNQTFVTESFNEATVSGTGNTLLTSADDGDYKVAKFINNGSFTITSLGAAPNNVVEYIVVAGGGGGSGGHGGGGGAGGMLVNTSYTVTAQAYAVVIGGGGTAGGGSDGGPGPGGPRDRPDHHRWHSGQ